MASARASKYAMIDVEEAWRGLGETIAGLESDAVCTARVNVENAVGHVLTHPISASAPVPPVACSRLDGYAVISPHEPGVFRVVAKQRAGHSTEVALEPGTVAWVTTGGAVPSGANAVIGVEASAAVDQTGAPLASCAPGSEQFVRLTRTVEPGANVRAAGSDMAAGTLIFEAGHVITPADVGTLLSCGVSEIVSRSLAVGVLSTGDEIFDHQATHSSDRNRVFDSNRPMLKALLASSGIRVETFDAGIVGDDYEHVLARISHAGFDKQVDMLITTGGVSMGDRDYVKPALEAVCKDLGGKSRVLFGRLNMKPGKPTTCAFLDYSARDISRRPVLVFALPGNPVSAFVGYHTLVGPSLRALAGVPWADAVPVPVPVTVLDSAPCDPERPEFHRVTVWTAAPSAHSAPAHAGGLFARSTGPQASSRLASTADANGLLWVPKQPGVLHAPFAGQVYLIGPVALQRSLPPELADTQRYRPAGDGAGAGGGGCQCGADHGELPSSHQAPSSAPASASAAAPSASPQPQPPPSSSGAGTGAGKAYPPHPTAPTALLTVGVAVVTVSDRCFAGATTDLAGPAVVRWLEEAYGRNVPVAGSRMCIGAVQAAVVPDDAAAIRAAATSMDSHPAVDLLITTGGTGMGHRDVTPEALRPLLARPTHGLQHAILAASLRATPMAALSRYEAGVTDKGTLVLQLPGSPKAVRECLDAIRVVLPHALAQLAEG